MSKKLMCLISVILLLSVAGGAGAGNIFNDNGTDHLWSNADNWSMGIVPDDSTTHPSEVVPKWYNAAEMSIDGTACVIDSDADAYTLQVGIYGGDNSCQITGGNITIGDWGVNIGRGGNDNPDHTGSFGHMTMSGGTLTAGAVKIPEQWGTGPLVQGSLVMTCGTINADFMTIGQAVGVGTVSLGGTAVINLTNSLSMNPDSTGSASLDITTGEILIGGDQTGTIQGYIDNGWITAYDGDGIFELDYGVRNPSKTTLTATIICPRPADGATGVGLQPELRWDEDPAPGDPNTYDVWFGPTGSMTKVSSGQSDPYYAITYVLNVNTTYQWQIVRYPGPVSGPVWSFTTTAGIATNPNPGDGATDVDTDVVLSWDGAAAAEAHDVYLSTSESAVSSRSGDAYLGRVTDANIDPDPDLDWNSQYYWAVDEVVGGEAQTGIGLVWDFTTKSCSLSGADGDSDADCRITLKDYSSLAGNWMRCGWSSQDVCP